MVKLQTATTRFLSRIALLLISVLGPTVASAQTLSAPDAMDVYRTIDSWVRQWEVEDEQITGESTPAFACVSVTLRLDGRVIGRGQIVNPDPNSESVALATRVAIAQARSWVRTKVDEEPTQDFWESMASRVTLSVELLDRIVPMSDTELGLPAMGLSPGVQALVMHLGERAEVMTPDEMISLGMGIEQAAYSMATTLSSDGAMALASVKELIDRGYSFSRGEPIWIAQSAADQGGVFLDRGSRMIEESSVGTNSVRAMSERIAGYLLAQRWPGAERYGIVGTREIVSGRANPEVALPYEQAMVATALLRFSEQGKNPIHTRSRDEAIRILQDLGAVQPGEPEPWIGIHASASLIALSYLNQEQIKSDEDLSRLNERCAKALESLYTPIDGFPDSVPTGARGLVAWSLVRSGNKYASSAVRAVFRDTPQGELVSQMPFLGWAELELAGKASEVPAATALNQMRSRMWDHQLVSSDLDWKDRDYLGAVVFTKGTSGLPTSRNLRPIAMICTMLGDPRLTPGTIADMGIASEIGHSAAAMRFVDQLVMSDASGFLSRSPDRTIGGIRSSLSEWEVSPASSAIALLAAIEFDRSIKAIGTRPVPGLMPE
tara:strand:- start:108321 stop:110138 length:1818 start_codon:yes stop_codon:yes gene_type:complete